MVFINMGYIKNIVICGCIILLVIKDEKKIY
jgi:hypothetical protein